MTVEKKKVIKLNKNQILIVIGIFLLAFALRIHMIQYNHFFEYDAYFEARMTWDLVTQGFLNNPDILAYYQLGGAPQTFTNFYWIINATIYNIFLMPFYGLDKFMFTKLTQILPAFWGAFIAITAYFLGKAATDDERVGVAMGFAAAVTPAFIYRSFVGAQPSNSFGFLPFILGMYFMIVAFKEEKISTRSIIAAVLTGIMFIIMVFSWNMFPLVAMVMIPGALYVIWHKIVNNESAQNAVVVSVISLGMFVGASFIKGTDVFAVAGSYAGISGNVFIAIIGITIGIIALFYIYLNIMKKTIPIQSKFLMGLVFLALLVIPLVLFNTVGDITDRNTVGSLVGEESIGNMFFLSKFNFFALLPFLALLILPICMINKSRLKENWPMIFFALTLFVTLIMAWYKLKFSFALGFGMIFAVGIVSFCILHGIDYLKQLQPKEQRFINIVCALILLMYVFAGANFILDYTPQVDREPELIAMIEWMKTTPEDSKFFNEWGLGHILTYETERAVSADNRNHSQLANALFGEFNVTSDVERGYDIIRNEIGADYVILSKDNARSFGGYEFYINNVVDYRLTEKYNVGQLNDIPCAAQPGIIICNGQQMTTEDFMQIPSIHNNNVTAFASDNTPVYYYRFHYNVIVLNQPVNESNFAKVFFQSDETADKYELVFDSVKYRVFKVVK